MLENRGMWWLGKSFSRQGPLDFGGLYLVHSLMELSDLECNRMLKNGLHYIAFLGCRTIDLNSNHDPSQNLEVF
jgi:hypothetical protein